MGLAGGCVLVVGVYGGLLVGCGDLCKQNKRRLMLCRLLSH